MNETKSVVSHIQYQLSEVVLSSIAPELRREVGQTVMPPPISVDSLPTSVDDIDRIASNNSVFNLEVHEQSDEAREMEGAERIILQKLGFEHPDLTELQS